MGARGAARPGPALTRRESTTIAFDRSPGENRASRRVGLGLGIGLGVGLASGLLPGTWAPFVIVRSWLALRGRLPWHLMAFLEDCHRLGILRQVSPVYQFRHARLQDHLARTPADPGIGPTPTPGSGQAVGTSRRLS